MIALAQQSNILDFPSVAPQGKSNEWYTPSRYIEAAREVMGGIDLDPASCELANETVRASKYYTEDDDGLSKAWHGRVWLNPPFGRVNGSGASKIKMFTTRLVDEYKANHVTQAILLSTVQPNAVWFYPLWEYSICFFRGRVHFNRLINGKLAKESRESHMLGTIFVYLGTNEQKFIETFSEFGAVIPANTAVRKHTIATPSLWEVFDDQS